MNQPRTLAIDIGGIRLWREEPKATAAIHPSPGELAQTSATTT